QDGWTVRQVVHHVADAHMVLYTRARTAVTEDNPFVKTWDEERWAELPDAKAMAIDGSLAIIDAVHTRFVHLLRALAAAQWERTMRHPDWGVISIDSLVDLCAWHGKHHTAHVVELRRRNSW
ncbi:MAG TPA: DinB family protein, partial [Gemmatimonadaceae bacterium]